MKKLFLIVGCFMLTAFILIGCSNKDAIRHKYTFKGENELWDAEYKVNSKITFTEKNGALDSESESKDVLKVIYKGELTDLSKVRHIEISYDCSANSGKMVSDYDEGEHISDKTFTLTSGGKNGAIPPENDKVTVTIIIDGNTQTFELKNN